MIFLASIWLLTCVLRTHLNELVQTMCAPSSYVGRKGEYLLKNLLVGTPPKITNRRASALRAFL